MPWIILTAKLYHDQRGKSSPIGDVGRLFINGRTIFINNDGGGPFGRGGIRLLGGGGSDLPWGGNNGPSGNCNSEHLVDQIPRSYITGLIGLWIYRAYFEFVVPFMVSYPTP
jgi:hypothetical protein